MATASHGSRTLPRACRALLPLRGTLVPSHRLPEARFTPGRGRGGRTPRPRRGQPLCDGGLTAQQDAAEQALPPLQGVAVPAVPAELVLALRRPGGHAAPDGEHGLGVPPAQLPLPAHQARHVVAHHPRGAHGAHVPAEGRGRAAPGAAAPGATLHRLRAKEAPQRPGAFPSCSYLCLFGEILYN